MIDWVNKVLDSLGYFGVALLTLLENVFPPVPSEIIMPLVGYVSTQGEISLIPAIAAGSLGSLAGTSVWYFAAKKIGEDRLKNWLGRHGRWLTIDPEDIDKAKEWFDRHGTTAVLICRFVPVVRTLISVPAGFARMPFGSFLLYSAVGTTLWTGLLTWTGYLLGENFKQVGSVLDVVGWAVIGFTAIWYIYRLIRGKRSIHASRGEQAS